MVLQDFLPREVLGMAIQCEFTDRFGVVYPEAIVRAVKTRITTQEISSVFFVYSSTDTIGKSRPLDKIRIVMPFTTTITGTKNYIKRSYEHLLAEGTLVNPKNI